MIGRIWRGRTSGDGAEAYAAHFRSDVVPSLQRQAGFRGAYLPRRDDSGEVEVVTLTLFDSMDAVRAFAGDAYEAAVVAPAAHALMREYDRAVRHYTVAVAPPESW